MQKYERSPIQEVVCEFQFTPHTAWDPVFPGLIYEQLRGEFPNRRLARHVALRVDPEEPTSLKTSTRVQFISPNEQLLIQVSENILAVNHLRPYDTWSTFAPVIHKAFKVYRDTVDPRSFRRIGLRYINRFTFEAPQLQLGHYFHFTPNVPPDMGSPVVEFSVIAVVDGASPADRLRVELSSTPGSQTAILLDLDYFLQQADSVSIDEYATWLEQAHEKLDAAFESAITDATRELIK